MNSLNKSNLLVYLKYNQLFLYFENSGIKTMNIHNRYAPFINLL